MLKVPFEWSTSSRAPLLSSQHWRTAMETQQLPAVNASDWMTVNKPREISRVSQSSSGWNQLSLAQTNLLFTAAPLPLFFPCPFCYLATNGSKNGVRLSRCANKQANSSFRKPCHSLWADRGGLEGTQLTDVQWWLSQSTPKCHLMWPSEPGSILPQQTTASVLAPHTLFKWLCRFKNNKFASYKADACGSLF